MRLENGWTGGQYSIFRFLFGCYLCIHFLALVPWGAELFSRAGALPDGSASPLLHLFPNILAINDSPRFVGSLLLLGAALSVPFALGWGDRAAAVGMWYILACLYGRNPLIANPALPFVGWMMLAHALLPAAPYGALAAQGRADPRGEWRMPQELYAIAWIVMALAYSYSGYTKLHSPSWVDGTALARVLQNPLARPTELRQLLLALPPIFLQLATWGGLMLELFYAPLSLFRRARPWIWTLMVLMHLGLLTVVDFADLTFGMLCWHFFTFNPAWIPPHPAGEKTVVFYDGHCGLCHGFVRFLLAEDRGGALEFSPLQGELFAAVVPEARRAGLPDSVVVRSADGRLLLRAEAVRQVLSRIGGLWRLGGMLLGLLPVRFSDKCYDAVARVRRKLFRRPADACPLVPPELRMRFHG